MNLPPDTKAGAADWMGFAACRHMDTSIWFPGDGIHGTGSGVYARAKAICNECPVNAQCDAYADSLPFAEAAFGMWAGLTPRTRRNRRTRSRPSNYDYGPGVCKICGIEYTKRTWNAQLCGDPECEKQNGIDAQLRYKRRQRERGAA